MGRSFVMSKICLLDADAQFRAKNSAQGKAEIGAANLYFGDNFNLHRR